MERKVKKVLLVAGMVTSAMVAMLPLTSYAAVTGPGYAGGHECNDAQAGNECAKTEGNEMEVLVNVADLIEIDAASGGDVIHVSPEMSRTGELTAHVRSAKPYTISLAAKDSPALENIEDNSFVIPASETIEAGKSGWGIKKFNADTYTALRQNPVVFYEGPANDEFTTTAFEIGVSVSSKIPQGTYSTEVEVTAAVKE